MTTDLLERHSTGFHHEALLYADSAELLTSLTDFIREGIAAAEPTLVVIPGDRLALIKEHIPDCSSVEYRDMLEVGRNPARLISLWFDFVRANGTPGRPLRGVVEPVWPARSPEELEECQIHESLLGVAFDGHSPWTLLCPYDTSSLEAGVVEHARRTHPSDASTGTHGSPGVEPWELLNGALASPPREATTFVFDADRLRDLRRLVGNVTAEAGLGERVEDFILAVNEVASNSLTHGGGRGQVRLWVTERGAACDVLDRGHIRDPLAGRRRPPIHRPGGHGLWLANQLCDLVQIRSRTEGTVVRLHMYSG